jgi:hypothetical protein
MLWPKERVLRGAFGVLRARVTSAADPNEAMLAAYCCMQLSSGKLTVDDFETDNCFSRALSRAVETYYVDWSDPEESLWLDAVRNLLEDAIPSYDPVYTCQVRAPFHLL